VVHGHDSGDRAAALMLRLIDAGRIAEAETLVLRGEHGQQFEKAGTPDRSSRDGRLANACRARCSSARQHSAEAIEQGNGAVPFDAECNRFENGFASGAGLLGAARHIFDCIQTIRPRRFTVDEERQTVFGNSVQPPGRHHLVNARPGRREIINAQRPFAVDVARRSDQGPQDPEGRGTMVSLPTGRRRVRAAIAAVDAASAAS
jgi:hypothetical protein